MKCLEWTVVAKSRVWKLETEKLDTIGRHNIYKQIIKRIESDARIISHHFKSTHLCILLKKSQQGIRPHWSSALSASKRKRAPGCCFALKKAMLMDQEWRDLISNLVLRSFHLPILTLFHLLSFHSFIPFTCTFSKTKSGLSRVIGSVLDAVSTEHTAFVLIQAIVQLGTDMSKKPIIKQSEGGYDMSAWRVQTRNKDQYLGVRKNMQLGNRCVNDEPGEDLSKCQSNKSSMYKVW